MSRRGQSAVKVPIASRECGVVVAVVASVMPDKKKDRKKKKNVESRQGRL